MAKTKKNSAVAEKTLKLMREKAKKRKMVKKVSKPIARPNLPPKQEISKQPAPKSPTKQKYSKEELEHFKSIILEKKKEIIEELDALKENMMDTTTGEYATENSTYSTHMEQGTDAMEREKTFLFASREGRFLNYLEDALARIEKGDYGRCVTCGKLIEKERLEAVPHASQCLQCKLHSHK